MRSVRRRVSDSSTTFLMWSGWLIGPPDPSTSKPNFVAMATWSRNGASASPTRVSLVYGEARRDRRGHRIRPRPTPPLGHQRDPAPSRQSTQLTTSSRPLHQDRCVKPFGAKGIARKVGTRQRAGGGAGTAYATIVISTASVAAFTRD